MTCLLAVCRATRVAGSLLAVTTLAACGGGGRAPAAPAAPSVVAPSVQSYPASQSAVEGSSLPSNPKAYYEQAEGVRRAVDRPWAPASGQLGNLRRLTILAKDCVVRIVSGGENRVFPGATGVHVVEESRVLDADPNEQPPPRDVRLAAVGTDACMGPGSCGVSITRADSAPRVGAGAECFTVQIATAHYVLLHGEGVDLLLDEVRQPALRLSVTPGYRLRVWFENVDLGLLSIRANAPVHIGGTGTIDWLQADSNNPGSQIFLHAFRANRTGVSSTTTNMRWSVRTGPDTWAGYHQPARAAGKLADLYPIEVDGPMERLEVPSGRVSARPISQATRDAALALRASVTQRAGPRPALAAIDSSLPTAAAAARALPRSASQHVADVVAKLLPSSVRLTSVTLWKKGGRVEGTAPDLETARSAATVLEQSGVFAAAQGGGGPRDGGFGFSVVLDFHCEAPGQPSECPVGHPASPDRYSEAQIRAALEQALGPSVGLRSLRVDGDSVHVDGVAAGGSDLRTDFRDLVRKTGMLRVSISGFGPSSSEGTQFTAVLSKHCRTPPRPQGVCALPEAAPGSRR